MLYTYKDWVQGDVNWITIETRKHEQDIISKDCLSKIRRHQNEIFEAETKKRLERLVASCNLNLRTESI